MPEEMIAEVVRTGSTLVKSVGNAWSSRPGHGRPTDRDLDMRGSGLFRAARGWL